MSLFAKYGFRRRRPWVTQFEIRGVNYGGTYVPSRHEAFRCFTEWLPRPRRVLELGCLEGGHSFLIAALAKEVVAIESRTENIAKARWLQRWYFRRRNLRFVQADLETFDLQTLGRFDVIFNVGLLYHLPEPWKLLRQLADCSESMVLWTHHAPDDAPLVERCGYEGVEYSEHGLADPLSGMSHSSFWPTRESLLRMLAEAGFDELDAVENIDENPNGPTILLRCRNTNAALQRIESRPRVVSLTDSRLE